MWCVCVCVCVCVCGFAEQMAGQDGTGGWYESFVVASRSEEVQVHYIGWPYTWDEWLPRASVRLRESTQLRVFSRATY